MPQTIDMASSILNNHDVRQMDGLRLNAGSYTGHGIDTRSSLLIVAYMVRCMQGTVYGGSDRNRSLCRYMNAAVMEGSYPICAHVTPVYAIPLAANELVVYMVASVL